MFMLFENVDKVLLGHYLGGDVVGIYSAAALLSTIVGLIPSAIVMVTGPATASYWARGELGSIQDLVNRITRYTAVIIVPISIAGLLLSRELILLIFQKEEFVSATVPLQILLAGYLFGGIFASVSTALTMTGWVQMAFVFGAVQLAINAALCTVLIPRFGMNGASASTAASLVFGTLLNLYFGRRFLKISVDWGWLARFLTVGAAVFAGGYALGLVVSPYISVVAGLAILAFVTVRYFLTAEDREMIRRLVPPRRRSS
jgi:O-antigen/teichoic acid export membrane protein